MKNHSSSISSFRKRTYRSRDDHPRLHMAMLRTSSQSPCDHHSWQVLLVWLISHIVICLSIVGEGSNRGFIVLASRQVAGSQPFPLHKHSVSQEYEFYLPISLSLLFGVGIMKGYIVLDSTSLAIVISCIDCPLLWNWLFHLSLGDGEGVFTLSSF